MDQGIASHTQPIGLLFRTFPLGVDVEGHRTVHIDISCFDQVLVEWFVGLTERTRASTKHSCLSHL